MTEDSRRPVGLSITSDPDVTSVEQPLADPARRAEPLPLRLLLVSDLAPHAAAGWSDGPSRVLRFDRNTFAGHLQALAPRLQIEVPNHVSGDAPKLLDVDLVFESLDAFRPSAVAAQVPALARLMEVRALVASAGSGSLAPDAFRERRSGSSSAW